MISRRDVPYEGRTLHEMDLDAVLARAPRLVLVDELAHTNAPGSRHAKRHGDVEELLAAGIDVYSTVNIQHVESLNDVVAGFTRVRVRETVPDGVLDRADDIEVVDLNPDDLIERLKAGKVYVPENAERALRHYFSRGNLTALRELALRRTADRVDDDSLPAQQRRDPASGAQLPQDRGGELEGGGGQRVAQAQEQRRRRHPPGARQSRDAFAQAAAPFARAFATLRAIDLLEQGLPVG